MLTINTHIIKRGSLKEKIKNVLAVIYNPSIAGCMKRLYKKIQDINSKLEIIQSQDKSLELNLKQLDTEENAISTEIDAVKKVISKNVESSFKTFNA